MLPSQQISQLNNATFPDGEKKRKRTRTPAQKQEHAEKERIRREQAIECYENVIKILVTNQCNIYLLKFPNTRHLSVKNNLYIYKKQEENSQYSYYYFYDQTNKKISPYFLPVETDSRLNFLKESELTERGHVCIKYNTLPIAHNIDIRTYAPIHNAINLLKYILEKNGHILINKALETKYTCSILYKMEHRGLQNNRLNELNKLLTYQPSELLNSDDPEYIKKILNHTIDDGVTFFKAIDDRYTIKSNKTKNDQEKKSKRSKHSIDNKNKTQLPNNLSRSSFNNTDNIVIPNRPLRIPSSSSSSKIINELSKRNDNHPTGNGFSMSTAKTFAPNNNLAIENNDAIFTDAEFLEMLSLPPATNHNPTTANGNECQEVEVRRQSTLRR